MDKFDQDRIYARHGRRTGAVLIVGAGSVGGFLAEELARVGVSPLLLVDHDVLAVENLVRHPLGASSVGKPKASILAGHISEEFPVCDAVGIDADFLSLSEDLQLTLVREADVVVAATDSVDCQRRVNEICIAAEAVAVYPGVWVGSGVRDAEVGEILWVLPGRHTPCYLCATSWRPDGAGAEARGGTRADIKVLVLALVQVVAALLDPSDERAQILNSDETMILVHGFMPASATIQEFFDGQAWKSIEVPFPTTRCPACRARAHPYL